MVFFFVGMAFEQRIGWKKFLTIYLLTGVCGALTHSLLNLGSGIVLIGASGAIFGILGAFAFSYPRDEVVMPIPLGIIMVFRRIKKVFIGHSTTEKYSEVPVRHENLWLLFD